MTGTLVGKFIDDHYDCKIRNVKNCKDCKKKCEWALDSYLADFRGTLDDESPTAQAIDNQEPVKRLVELARKECHHEFVALLDMEMPILVER